MMDPNPEDGKGNQWKWKTFGACAAGEEIGYKKIYSRIIQRNYWGNISYIAFANSLQKDKY